MGALYLHHTPNGKQWDFYETPEKYVLLLGAAGSGKTVSLCVRDLMLAQEFPGSVGVIFRKSYPALRDTTKRTYLEALIQATVHLEGAHTCPGCADPAVPHDPAACAGCKPAWSYLVANEVKSEGREEIQFTNGSRTVFRCLDDYKKLGSTAYDRIGVDEAIEVEQKEFLTLIARLRGRVGPRRLFLATNPPDEDHWLFDWFETQAAPDKRVIHSTTYDNRQHLDADYITELEKYPASWKEKFLYGRWGFLAEGKPVFPEFNPEIHLADDLRPVPGRPIIRGWDFGFRHPACVWLQVTPTDHVHVLHELLGTDEDLRSFTGRVLDETVKHFPGLEVEDYCDVAGTQRNDRGPTAVQVLHEFGIWPNYRKFGVWQCVERLAYLLRTVQLGVPLLQVSVTCRVLRKALAGGYRMDGKKDEPEKDGYYDNIVDALKYGVMPVTAPPPILLAQTVARPASWRLPL